MQVKLLNLLMIFFPLKIFSATVQASFRLERPVSQLIPYIERLEYDIFTEIALPNTKVSAKLLLLFFISGLCLYILLLTGGYPIHAPKC